jgi:uncharacterized protein HemY
LFIESDKADMAKSLLQQAKEDSKDLPEVLNDLAWFMVMEPKLPVADFASALQMAKQAVDKNPENGNFWNTLGATHYRRREWQDAITALEKARELHGGGDGFDFIFLAMAHWQLGNKKQAQDWYQKAAASIEKAGPQKEELTRIQKEADQLMHSKEVSRQ